MFSEGPYFQLQPKGNFVTASQFTTNLPLYDHHIGVDYAQQLACRTSVLYYIERTRSCGVFVLNRRWATKKYSPGPLAQAKIQWVVRYSSTGGKRRDVHIYEYSWHTHTGNSHFWTENKRCLLLKAATTFTAGLSLLSLKLVSAAIQPSALDRQQTTKGKYLYHRREGGRGD